LGADPAALVTGAIIGAVGTVLAAIFTILVGYFVKRTDSAAKMTRANMQDQRYVMQLVGTLRDDYWTLADAWYALRGVASAYRAELIALGQHDRDLIPMPAIPKAEHRELEARHGRGENTDEDPK
jgi:hypothetical protein